MVPHGQFIRLKRVYTLVNEAAVPCLGWTAPSAWRRCGSIMILQPKIGQRLATARLRRSRSQASVARDAGIAPSYLSRIETGKIQPTYRTLSRIARAMDVRLDELVPFNPAEHRRGSGCPISQNGDCLLDLIWREGYAARGPRGEGFTVSQIRLIREFALFVRRIPADRQYALTVLMTDLLWAWDERANEVGSDTSRTD